jgi:hypothetical protein
MSQMETGGLRSSVEVSGEFDAIRNFCKSKGWSYEKFLRMFIEYKKNLYDDVEPSFGDFIAHIDHRQNRKSAKVQEKKEEVIATLKSVLNRYYGVQEDKNNLLAYQSNLDGFVDEVRYKAKFDKGEAKTYKPFFLCKVIGSDSSGMLSQFEIIERQQQFSSDIANLEKLVGETNSLVDRTIDWIINNWTAPQVDEFVSTFENIERLSSEKNHFESLEVEEREGYEFKYSSVEGFQAEIQQLEKRFKALMDSIPDLSQ